MNINITLSHEGKDIPTIFGISEERLEDLAEVVNKCTVNSKRSLDMGMMIDYINSHPELNDAEVFILIYAIGYVHGE